MEKGRKLDIELTFLLLFLLAFSYFGISSILDHSITNPYPKGMLASDPFHYYNYMQGLDERGKFDLFPFYISYGRDDVVAYQPPLYYVNGVILGNIFSIENYDSLNLLLLLSLLAGIVTLFYLIKRNIGPSVAVLSLPLVFFIFVPNFIFGILWGRQPTMFTEVLLILLFWFLLGFDSWKISDTKKGLVLGAMLSALVLGHVPQFLFGGLFAAVFFGVRYLKRRSLLRQELKMLIIAAVLLAVLSSYYLVIFKTTISQRAGPIIAKVLASEASNRFVSFADFRYFSVIIVLGILVSFLFKHKRGYSFAYFMLLIGLTNYIIGKRGIEVRFMWPFFLAVFVGGLVYLVMKTLKVDPKYSYVVSALLAVLILGTIYNPALGRGSLANQPSWEGLQYLQENTERDAKVVFMYGPGFDQGAYITASERLSYLVYPNELIEHLNSRRIDRLYESRLMGEGQAGMPYRKAGKMQFYADEFEDRKDRDLCSYDYYVFGKAGRIQELAVYNLLIANELLKSPVMEKAFENDLIVILHNTDKTKDCINPEGVPLEL